MKTISISSKLMRLFFVAASLGVGFVAARRTSGGLPLSPLTTREFVPDGDIGEFVNRHGDSQDYFVTNATSPDFGKLYRDTMVAPGVIVALDVFLGGAAGFADGPPGLVSPTGFNIGRVFVSYNPNIDADNDPTNGTGVYFVAMDISAPRCLDSIHGTQPVAFDLDGDGSRTTISDIELLDPITGEPLVSEVPTDVDEYRVILDLNEDERNDVRIIIGERAGSIPFGAVAIDPEPGPAFQQIMNTRGIPVTVRRYVLFECLAGGACPSGTPPDLARTFLDANGDGQATRTDFGTGADVELAIINVTALPLNSAPDRARLSVTADTFDDEVFGGFEDRIGAIPVVPEGSPHCPPGDRTPECTGEPITPCGSRTGLWSVVQGAGDKFHGVSDVIRSMATYNGELYVGGDFAQVGDHPAARIARWNGASWAPLQQEGQSQDGANDVVRAMAVYNGELYIGGDFVQVGGTAASRVARWNGTSWIPFFQGANDVVRAITAYKGELYIGGDFVQVGGTSASRIARWDGTYWDPLRQQGQNQQGANDVIRAMAVYNGELYIGGDFVQVGGTSVSRIARWNGSSWASLQQVGQIQDGANDVVRAMAVYGGELYVGGDFVQVGGTSASRVARWNGFTWAPLQQVGQFQQGANDVVHAMAVYAGELYIGGDFVQVGGTSASRIVRWNGTSWAPLRQQGQNQQGANDVVRAMAMYGGELYIGGDFVQVGGTSASHIARVHVTEGCADLNNDGFVNSLDFISASGASGCDVQASPISFFHGFASGLPCIGGPCGQIDINSNGVFDLADFALIQWAWGTPQPQ